MDEIEWASQFRPAGPVTVQDVLNRQMALPDRAELQQDAAERAAAAAREDRAEAMRLANHQMGDPLGNLTRSQMAAAEARDKVRALEDQLEEARRVLHRAAEQYISYQEQAEQVTAIASRSVTHDDLAAPARLAHEEFRQATRAKVAEMSSGTTRRERRPFASRGSVARSEQCVWCTAEGVDDETSYLLHSDPEFAVPVTSPEQAARRAGRGHVGAGEISR